MQIHDPTRLRHGDAKDAQEDVPQVKSQLVLHMLDQILGATPPVLVRLGFLLLLVDAERLLLVRVGGADADGDGEDGDVHHDEQAELHAGADHGEDEAGCARVSCRGGLEDGGEDAFAHGEDVDLGVVQVEHDDEQGIDEVEREQDAEEHPGRLAGEQQRVAAPGVVEQKVQGLLQVGVLARRELGHGPDDEAEEDGVEGVAGKGEEAHDEHGPLGVAEGDHGVGREGEAEVVHHGLGGVECPLSVVSS